MAEHHKNELSEVISLLRSLESELGVRLVTDLSADQTLRGKEISLEIDVDNQERETYAYAYLISLERLAQDAELKTKCVESICKLFTDKSIECDHVGDAIKIGSDQLKTLISQQSKLNDLVLDSRGLEADVVKACQQLVDSQEHATSVMDALMSCHNFAALQLKICENQTKTCLNSTHDQASATKNDDESIILFRTERVEALLNKGFSREEIVNIMDINLDELRELETKIARDSNK